MILVPLILLVTSYLWCLCFILLQTLTRELNIFSSKLLGSRSLNTLLVSSYTFPFIPSLPLLFNGSHIESTALASRVLWSLRKKCGNWFLTHKKWVHTQFQNYFLRNVNVFIILNPLQWQILFYQIRFS